MRLSFLWAILLPVGLFSQTTIVNMPTNGTTDTSNACSGILVDGGGINGNYTSYNNGYVIIDPPGNDTVNLTFTTWSLYHSSDYIQVWDGVGTGSTYLGYYSGSTSTPPSTYVGASGALTVRFYSNYFGNSAGFVASWSASGTTAPTANFTYSSSSQSYNTPIQFVNTSSNGGNSFWDFGDGTTSTDVNPVHSFTTSGTQTVTLVETNCNTSDTTTSTINIGAAPNGSVSNDTIFMSIPCGTTATQGWTISNGSSGGNLTFTTEIQDTNYAYNASFEDGTLEGFSLNSNSQGSIANSTADAYTGSKSMLVTGYINTSYMPTTTFSSTQATSASFATKNGNTSTNTGYFWFESSTYSGLGGSPFGYTYWTGSYLRVYYRNANGSTTYYLHTPASTANGWANVSYENIDWNNKTFDLVLDGTTVATGASFYYSSASDISNFSGYTYNSSASIYIDDVKVSGGNAIDLTYSPTSGTVASGNNVVVNFTVDATDLLNGTYYLFLKLTSNDTLLNGTEYPIVLDITGAGTWNMLNANCTSLNTYSGTLNEDTLKIYNSGCDTLEVSSITSSSTRIASLLSSFTVAPDDTVKVPITYTASTAGSYNDSLYFIEKDSTYSFCISSTVSNAASIKTDSTVFNVSVLGCPDTVTVPFWVYNDGQNTLNWGTYSSGITIEDDFETGSFNSSLWSSYYGSYISSGCSTIGGNYSLTYYGTSGTRYATTVGLNLTSGGTISFDLEQGSCELADNGEGMYLQYSTNGYSWITIQYFYPNNTYTTYNCSATIPTGAMTTNTQIRLAQLSNSGSSYDNLIVDNFKIDAGLGQNLTFQPDTGNIAVMDSELVKILIYTDSLADGYYTYNGFVSSNDPVDSLLYLTVNLTLDGISETYINRNSCFNLDTIVKGGTYIDSVLVENLGCDSLDFITLTTTNSSISASAAYNQIGVGDSGWVITTITPTSIGAISDTVYVKTSDTTWPLCYSGYVAEAPNAWVNTSPIVLSTTNCGDSVGFSFPVVNTAAGTTLNWSVTSGEVLNVLLVNYNVYPSLLTNLNTFLGTVGDLNIKPVTTLSAAVSQLGWADVVIFPSITSTPTTTDYTNIEDDMETFINDGGKMIVMGSSFVGDILAMDFINGYYYGNYTNYTHYVNTSLNHPYTQGMPTSFTAQSAALNSRIYNTGTQNLVYYSYYSHGLTVSPIGDGELIYFAYNFNQTYSEIETLMSNILTTTLADKATGLNWISFPTTSGSTNGGDSTTVFGTALSDSLPAGTHNLNISVSTNDPTGGFFSIPVTLTVNGKGESSLDAGCENFGSSFQNMTHTQEVSIYNVGCDTLTMNSASTSGSDFSCSATNIVVAPGDTGYIPVDLYSTTIGSVSDTLEIYTDADTVYKCLTATIVGASDIAVAPNPINVTVNKCNSFTTVPYTITNNGSAALTYDVSVAEVYDSAYTQTWLYPAPNYSNQLTFSFNNIIDSDTLFYDIVLNGAYSNTNQYFYLYLNNSYVQTFYDNNVTDYTDDTISGFITGWQLTNAITAGYFDLRIYSYNYTSVTGQTATMHVRQKKSVSWSTPVGLTSGTVSTGSTVSKSLLVTVSTLALGTYNTSVIFETNDPSDPFYSVPMTVNVVSEPDMDLSTNSLSYGNIYDTAPYVDSIVVENNGCTDLSITNISSNNAHFVPGWTTQTIAAGSSALLPVTFTATTPGTENGILTFSNNDSIQLVTMQANVVFAPVADYQYTVQNNCTGLVSFSNESTNGDQYFWAFGDGLFSAAVNPSHTYERPGIYNVMLVTTNSGGSDTTYKSVTLNDILYVDFEFPATVQAGQVTQFIDSSMYPVSWNWFFGDGNNSTTPNPQHTYANQGTFIVTLLAENSAGCTGSENKQIVVQSGIGIDERAPEDLVIYPVPTAGRLNIETSAAVEKISLYTLTGRLIMEVQNNRSLDLSSLPAGSYMLRIAGPQWVINRTVEVVK